MSKWVGADMKDTIGVGDGPNDMEMLRTVAVSVAMGERFEDLKALADVVTDDVGEDGIKKCLQKIRSYLKASVRVKYRESVPEEIPPGRQPQKP